MPSAYRVEKWASSSSPDPDALRRRLSVDGYSVFQWTDQPGAEYDSHHHDDEQSHWIMSGMLELTVDGAGVFILEAGDRDFMPAGTEHTARVVGAEPVTYLIGARRRG